MAEWGQLKCDSSDRVNLCVAPQPISDQTTLFWLVVFGEPELN